MTQRLSVSPADLSPVAQPNAGEAAGNRPGLVLVMLTGAALLIQSLYLLQGVDPGFRTEQLLDLRLMPLPGGYRGIDNNSYYRTIDAQIRALPGVRHSGFTRLFPRVTTEPTGQPIGFVTDAMPAIRAVNDSVSPGVFEAIGARLIQGRFPLWTDTATSLVAVYKALGAGWNLDQRQ